AATDGGASDDTFALTVSTRPLLLTASAAGRASGAVRPVRVAAVSTDKRAAVGADGDSGGAENGDSARVVLSPGPVTPLPGGDAGLSQLLRLWGVFGADV